MLEDRCLLDGSQGYLLIPSKDTDNVLRYDGATGAFVDEFVKHKSGGLNQPTGAIFGPFDHNLYVSSGFYGGPGQKRGVLRYDGNTGKFLGEFAEPGHLEKVGQILFGPDGNGDGRQDMYVRNGIEYGPGDVVRYDGTTGAFIDEFVPYRDDLRGVANMVFGPSVEDPDRLDLYAASGYYGHVLRFHGETGAYLGVFADPVSDGLGYAGGVSFGPDGHLYVAASGFSPPHAYGGPNGVVRYQGPGDPTPGAFIDVFVPPGRGGLLNPFGGVLFGPDGNGDGHQDLYVTSGQWVASYETKEHTSSVKRYDGLTGAFIDTFVKPDSGGLSGPWMMAFDKTDPTTLAYMGSGLTATAIGLQPASKTLRAGNVQLLLTLSATVSTGVTSDAGIHSGGELSSRSVASGAGPAGPVLPPVANIPAPHTHDQALGQLLNPHKTTNSGWSPEIDAVIDLLVDPALASPID